MSTRTQKRESEAQRKCRLTEQYHKIGIKAVAAAVKAKSAQQSDKASRGSLSVKGPEKTKE